MKTDANGPGPANTEKRRNFWRTVLAVVAAAAGFGHGAAMANPAGPTVVNGQVGFARQDKLFSITNSPGAIINWQSFSINPGDVTRFIQQNSSSSVLNRIVGQEPSTILGALQSNGRVFLINPNGILFGPGARVDVNGLVASTLNLSNADFLAGKRNFSAGNTAGDIRNQGLITTPSGGQVYLIATNVENSGIVTSPQGEVVLAAGHTVQLVDSTNPDLHVVVSASASRALNLGQIIAEGGKVGIYGALIAQRGIVNANSAVVGQNGKIVFKASGDTLLEAGSRTSATGAGSGGEIHVLGNRVGLVGDASVDASGQTGGGTVLVGGDYHGANPAIQNATQSYLGADAEIKADALRSGNGGKVIVWSDQATRVYGAISARGGSLSGNGGFVETSGKFLDMQARVDTRAPRGVIGSLLLDPTDIYIANNLTNAQAAGMSSTDLTADASGPVFIATGAPLDSLLTVGVLTSALNSSSVTVSTHSQGLGKGTIKVVDPVTWCSGFGLAMSADGDILINAALSGPGPVSLYSARGNISQGSNAPISVGTLLIESDAGTVTLLNPGNNVSVLAGYAAAGSFSFAGASGFAVGVTTDTYGTANLPYYYTGTTSGAGNGPQTRYPSAPGLATGGGNISLTSISGAINVGSGINAGTGSVTLNAGTAINAGGGIIHGASLKATAANGIGAATMPLVTQIVGTLSATNSGAGGDINIVNSGALVLQNVTQINGSGNISIDNTGALTVADSTLVSTRAGSISLVAHSPLAIAGAVTSTTGSISLEAGASGSPNDILSITGSVSSVSGNVSLKAGEAINGASFVTTGGSVMQTAYTNGPPSPPNPSAPTLSECTQMPTLAGCSAVLPTVSQCAANPSDAGCQAVLPPLQAQIADPVIKATASTITAMNTSTSAMSGSATSDQEGGAGTGASTNGDKISDSKTVSAESTDSGVKKDHVAKKMYCN